MKISVLLPNFNHRSTLGESIQGVLHQAHEDWELIVVDDGSSDDSRSVIEKFMRLDSRVHGVFFPENRGAIAAVQAAASLATGELVYGGAADDHLSNARFFELAVSALRRYPTASGFFAKASVVDSATGKELWTMGASPKRGYLAPREAMRAFLLNQMFVPGASAVWRRALLEEIGGFAGELGPQTDYFVNHALPALAGVVFGDATVAVVRASTASYSAAADDAVFFERHAQVERKLMSLPLPYHVKPTWLHQWRRHLINGRLALTRQIAVIRSVREAYADAEPWEARALPESFREWQERTLADCAEMERRLTDRIELAERVFEEVAGRLPLKDTDRLLDPLRSPCRPSLAMRVTRKLRRAVDW